jgi:hypothetical protein
MDAGPRTGEDPVTAWILVAWEIVMSRIEWPSLARVLAWTVAVAFVGGTVLVVILSSGLIGSPQEHLEDFIDSIIADFAYQQTLWPFELLGTTLFAVGFLALGALGPALGRLAAPDDARQGLVTAAFLGAGGLGTASQLLWIGTRAVAISPQYCDCGLRAEEIMSRLMALNIVTSVQALLISGAMVAAAVGLVTAAALGREHGMPMGWWWLSWVAAVVALVGAVVPLLRVYPVDLVIIALVAGILVPIWALWLASRADAVWAVAGGETGADGSA